MKRRRKMDKVRDCYSKASIVFIALLAAFTLYRMVT